MRSDPSTTQALLEQARAQYESRSRSALVLRAQARAWPNRSAGRVVELEQRKKEADAALEAAQKNEVKPDLSRC
jgi:hypothetical protein